MLQCTKCPTLVWKWIFNLFWIDALRWKKFPIKIKTQYLRNAEKPNLTTKPFEIKNNFILWNSSPPMSYISIIKKIWIEVWFEKSSFRTQIFYPLLESVPLFILNYGRTYLRGLSNSTWHFFGPFLAPCLQPPYYLNGPLQSNSVIAISPGFVR